MHWWRGETPPGGDERGATTRWSKNPKKDQLDMVGSLSCHALRTASVAASGINASDLPPVTSTSTLDGHCFLDSKIGQGVEGFEDSACSVSLHFRPYPPPRPNAGSSLASSPTLRSVDLYVVLLVGLAPSSTQPGQPGQPGRGIFGFDSGERPTREGRATSGASSAWAAGVGFGQRSSATVRPGLEWPGNWLVGTFGFGETRSNWPALLSVWCFTKRFRDDIGFH